MGKGTRIESMALRPTLPVPASLVTEGRVNFGTFDGPLRIVNPLDARSVFGVPLPRSLTYLRLKEWQAFQLGNDDWFMLVVIYNQKIASLVQFLVYDRRENRAYRYERRVPSWRVSVPSSLYETNAHYRSHDFSIEFRNRLMEGRIEIDVSASGFRGMPPVTGRFVAAHDASSAAPLVVSLPLGANRGMYSHKCLMPMSGELLLGGRRVSFAQKNSFAIMDDHKGFYPYVLRYDWVTGAGFNRKGDRMAFNLTDNQVRDQERYNENCLWINNRVHLLPPVTFSRPKGPDGEWIITDRRGMVDLRFSPTMKNEIMVNLLLIKTDYYGPFGSFTGAIGTTTGERISVNGFFGMGEQKYLRG